MTKPANHGEHHAEEDDGRGVIRNDVVDVTRFSGEAGHHKIRGDADNQDGEGANGQQNESRKDKDVKCSRDPVARMLPLSQPELEEFPSRSRGRSKRRSVPREPAAPAAWQRCRQNMLCPERERSGIGLAPVPATMSVVRLAVCLPCSTLLPGNLQAVNCVTIFFSSTMAPDAACSTLVFVTGSGMGTRTVVAGSATGFAAA